MFFMFRIILDYYYHRFKQGFQKAHQSCDIQSVHRISVKCKHFVGCYLSSLTRRNVYVRYINIEFRNSGYLQLILNWSNSILAVMKHSDSVAIHL